MSKRQTFTFKVYLIFYCKANSFLLYFCLSFHVSCVDALALMCLLRFWRTAWQWLSPITSPLWTQRYPVRKSCSTWLSLSFLAKASVPVQNMAAWIGMLLWANFMVFFLLYIVLWKHLLNYLPPFISILSSCFFGLFRSMLQCTDIFLMTDWKTLHVALWLSASSLFSERYLKKKASEEFVLSYCPVLLCRTHTGCSFKHLTHVATAEGIKRNTWEDKKKPSSVVYCFKNKWVPSLNTELCFCRYCGA